MEAIDDVECQNKLDIAVKALVVVLRGGNGILRMHARGALVSIGDPAVPELIKSIRSENEDERLEATKALGGIRNPQAARSLVQALEDQSYEVRYAAAESLAALGLPGVKVALQALISKPDSYLLRTGIHHAFRILRHSRYHRWVEPVISALESQEPEIEVIAQAKSILQALDQIEKDYASHLHGGDM
jgi:HEAT repeat protein